jgi:Tfp pilus assembly protein PilX
MKHQYSKPIIRAQRGLSLIFAIMTLVVMSLAAVALVRSVDIGALILGNISFKQDATSSSAVVTAAAIAALDARRLAGSLDVDDSANGYYANSLDDLDPTGGNTSTANPMRIVSWYGDATCSYAAAGTFKASGCVQAKLGAAVNGSTVRWVITRLCKFSEAQSPTNPCLRPVQTATASASARGALTGGGRITGVSTSPYYRIIVRTEGARDTVSFTEALVHF